jgi:hypothetical protein
MKTSDDRGQLEVALSIRHGPTRFVEERGAVAFPPTFHTKRTPNRASRERQKERETETHRNNTPSVQNLTFVVVIPLSLPLPSFAP